MHHWLRAAFIQKFSILQLCLCDYLPGCSLLVYFSFALALNVAIHTSFYCEQTDVCTLIMQYAKHLRRINTIPLQQGHSSA